MPEDSAARQKRCSDLKWIFKYLRWIAELERKHICKWQSMTWLWCRKNINWGMGYMPLSCLPLDWCGRNMKALSYMLDPLGWCGRNMKALSSILLQSCTLFMYTVNDKVSPDLDLGRRSNWGRGVCYWKVLPWAKTYKITLRIIYVVALR